MVHRRKNVRLLCLRSAPSKPYTVHNPTYAGPDQGRNGCAFISLKLAQKHFCGTRDHQASRIVTVRSSSSPSNTLLGQWKSVSAEAPPRSFHLSRVHSPAESFGQCALLWTTGPHPEHTPFHRSLAPSQLQNRCFTHISRIARRNLVLH